MQQNRYEGTGRVYNQSNSTITGSGYVVNGSNNNVKGDGCVVNGSNCKVKGDWCVVNGSNNKVDGDGCKVTGSNNRVTGAWCVVKGSNNTWNGNPIIQAAWSSGVTVTTTDNFGNMTIDHTGVGFAGANYGGTRIINFGNAVGTPSGFVRSNGTVTVDGESVLNFGNMTGNNQGAMVIAHPSPLETRARDRDRSPPRAADTIYPAEWTEEPAEAPAGKAKCAICLVREVRVTAIPCGHLSICVECCRATRTPRATCAICRAGVDRYQLVFVTGAE